MDILVRLSTKHFWNVFMECFSGWKTAWTHPKSNGRKMKKASQLFSNIQLGWRNCPVATPQNHFLSQVGEMEADHLNFWKQNIAIFGNEMAKMILKVTGPQNQVTQCRVHAISISFYCLVSAHKITTHGNELLGVETSSMPFAPSRWSGARTRNLATTRLGLRPEDSLLEHNTQDRLEISKTCRPNFPMNGRVSMTFVWPKFLSPKYFSTTSAPRSAVDSQVWVYVKYVPKQRIRSTLNVWLVLQQVF